MKNQKEIILYGICGGFTTFLNIGLFYILNQFINYKLSNLITLILVKLLSYVLNKTIVFRVKQSSKKELGKEFIRYGISRTLTFGIDYFGLILLVDYYFISKTIGKIIMTTIVVIINYLLGKKYVFTKKNTQ